MAQLKHKDSSKLISNDVGFFPHPKKASKTRSKSDKLHLSRITEMGCIVCLLELHVYTTPEIHHIRTGQGLSQRADDKSAIGLCPGHHRLGGYGVAIHAGQKEFEKNHGTELELLAQVNGFLNAEDLAK